MEFVVGSRRTGRTTVLLAESAGQSITILCHTQAEKRRLIQEAERAELTIPTPLTYEEAMRPGGLDGVKCISIDNLEFLLSSLFPHVKIRKVVALAEHYKVRDNSPTKQIEPRTDCGRQPAIEYSVDPRTAPIYSSPGEALRGVVSSETQYNTRLSR